MALDSTQPNDLPDEELTAYLDQELPAEEARRIEKRLAGEPALRQRLHELQKTWDMLDVLPKGRATQAFTSSTLSMVAVTAEQEVRAVEQASQLQGVAWWVGGVAAAAAAALIAFTLTQSQLSRPNQELARDLPVIERLDQYRFVDKLEFLQRLDQEGLFAPEDGDAP